MVRGTIDGIEETYRALRERVAWRLVPRDGVLVAGPGAWDWLQGQVSQDLTSLSPAVSPPPGGDSAPSVETLVLSPQGKIDAYCRLTVVGPEHFLLDVRAGFGERLEERLRRFKLRVKADLEPWPGLTLVEVRGPATPPAADLVVWGGGEAVGVVDFAWDGLAGRDVIFGPGSAVPSPARSELPDQPGDDAAFEAARIEAGIPHLGTELTERTIPQEAGELVARAVSFTKGCYTGQELVARIDARGSNTPRRLQGVVISPPASPDRGDALLVDGSTIGEITSVAWSPGLAAYVALAYVKRGTQLPCQAAVVTSSGAVPGEVRPLPLSSG